MPSSKSSVDHRDVYYRLGKSAGYRARSAYKLLHLDEEFGLFEGVHTAVDLCAAPGSWSQVLGQKLKPGKRDIDNKVVSVDLQSMAPLPNISIIQTDITLPSTIPLVLDALGGRKADLVVCDGAPDVTGVHDLDAYLHSQLILAALTLSLTLLAPHATLIFKIFLSPLDPEAAMLRSQLESFFPGPSNSTPFAEFDETDTFGPIEGESSVRVSRAGLQGFDSQGRRGGVWVRKPRSSRKGSGEAFIVCRNFDASTVPLPITFSPAALASLAQQNKGTLTLDSLSQLVAGSVESSQEWETIKPYVGGGDLSTMTVPSSGPTFVTAVIPRERRHLTLDLNATNTVSRTTSVRSVRELHPQPTPCEEPEEYFRLKSPPLHGQFLEPTSAGLSDLKAKTNSTSSVPSRQISLESLKTPSSSSPSHVAHERPWEKQPTPLPTPRKSRSPDGLSATKARDILRSTPHGDGAVSPALSSSSKTDLFFGTSVSDGLPTPPKPITKSSFIGQGRPGNVKGHDRTVSLPTMKPGGTSAKLGLDGPVDAGRFAPKDFFSPIPRVTTDSIPSTPLSTLPTHPEVSTISRLQSSHARRESQHILRENREAPVDEAPLRSGDILAPSSDERQFPIHSDTVQWKLSKPLGEGAFSAVWSAEKVVNDSGSPAGMVAVKLTSRATCSTNSRTRIAFLREVSVLRHISHPNVVSFLASFSTSTHHCLVLEQIGGGELFDLVSDECNRSRMLLPGPGDEVGEGFIRRIFAGVTKGVGWLHEVGVVHRDIKLENLLFTINPFTLPPTATGSIPLDLLPTPLVKLTDFGLSRFINPASPVLRTRCGSESFAAPEIIMGKEYDGRETDAWAMGVVLFALVTGELPFDVTEEHRGEREERKRRMMRIAKGHYDWPNGVGSTAVRDLVAHLLVRDPTKRSRVADLWDEPWMRGPGEVDRPIQSNGVVDAMGAKRRRILDGFLLDEEVEEVAQTEMEP